VLRLRKQVDYWKEQAGLMTAEQRAAADLREVADRRATPGPDDELLGGAGSSTAPNSARQQRGAGAGGGTDAGSSVCGVGGVEGSVGGWSEVDGAAADE